MTLSILISTIDQGVNRIPNVILPPQDGIEWVVSVQFTGDNPPAIPEKLKGREDVKISTLKGRGLSRNRNNALTLATGNILLIADDDNRYTPERLQTIITTFEEHPDADLICFAAESYDQVPMKWYPKTKMPFIEAFRQGYYPTSMEMTMRRDIGIRFDERFGLGSAELCCGEEDVFIKDALDKGKNVLFVPTVIVSSRFETTGTHFLHNKKVQVSKGATFRYLFGTPNALWRTVKEAGWYMLHKGANPFPILFNMIEGIYKF